MKTVLIAHNYTKDSFAYMSYGVANYLSNNGYRVVFVSHKPFISEKNHTINKNGELILTSWSTKDRPTGLRDILWFSKIYFQYHPDYVIGHFVGANISILMSKIHSFGKVKCYSYYHTLSTQISKDLSSNIFKYKLKKYRKKIFFKLFVDKHICPSELAKQDILKTFSLTNSNKVKVILNAIEDRSKNSIKQSTKNEIVGISYLGRLDPSKNVKLLVESFLDFKKNNPKSNLELKIAGSGQESKEIKMICDDYSYLTFKGELSYDQVDDFLSSSSYSIIPSFSDNLPTVGIESLMNHTPIIISVNTGLSLYCSDNINSILFSPSKNNLIKIFEKINDNEYEEMSYEARRLFEKKFSIENYCNEIENLIKKNS